MHKHYSRQLLAAFTTLYEMRRRMEHQNVQTRVTRYYVEHIGGVLSFGAKYIRAIYAAGFSARAFVSSKFA